MMNESAAPSIAELRRQVEELEAENRRLRGLLSIDDRDRSAPAEPWKADLFPQPEPGNETGLPPVDQPSPSQRPNCIGGSAYSLSLAECRG